MSGKRFGGLSGFTSKRAISLTDFDEENPPNQLGIHLPSASANYAEKFLPQSHT